jgi:hypothetical protein
MKRLGCAGPVEYQVENSAYSRMQNEFLGLLSTGVVGIYHVNRPKKLEPIGDRTRNWVNDQNKTNQYRQNIMAAARTLRIGTEPTPLICLRHSNALS